MRKDCQLSITNLKYYLHDAFEYRFSFNGYKTYAVHARNQVDLLAYIKPFAIVRPLQYHKRLVQLAIIVQKRTSTRQTQKAQQFQWITNNSTER